MIDPVAHNRSAWDERARAGQRHARTVLAKDLANPLPILDPEGWLQGNVRGLQALCLASGGGLQSGLLAGAGAVVTVVDVSEAMLDLDRQIAARHGFNFRLLATSMDDLSALGDGTFDLILHPVSTCYLPEIGKVFREASRVLRTGGLYISQHKQPTSLQASTHPVYGAYAIQVPANHRGALPRTDIDALHRESEMVEFLHSWEAIIGGICQAGFVIEGLVEPPTRGHEAESLQQRSRFLPPYVKIKARKMSAAAPRLHIA